MVMEISIQLIAKEQKDSHEFSLSVTYLLDR